MMNPHCPHCPIAAGQFCRGEQVHWFCELIEPSNPKDDPAHIETIMQQSQKWAAGSPPSPASSQCAHHPAARQRRRRLARLGIQFLTGGPLLVSQAELDRRLAICQPCPNWTGSRCTACGCFGQLKARLESETGQCPEGNGDTLTCGSWPIWPLGLP